MKLKFNYIIIGLIFLFVIASITISASGRMIRKESITQPEIPPTITGLKMAFKNMEKEIPYIKFDEDLIIKHEKNLRFILRKMKETNRGLETLKEIFSIFENLETIIQWRFNPNFKVTKVVIESDNIISSDFAFEYVIDLDIDLDEKFKAYNFLINLPQVLENYKQNDSKFFKYLSSSIGHEFGHALVKFQEDINKEYVNIPEFNVRKYKIMGECSPIEYQAYIRVQFKELLADKVASELATRSAYKIRLESLAQRRLKNPKDYKLMPPNIMKVIAGLEIFGMDKLSNSLRVQYKDLMDENLISDFKSFFNNIVIRGRNED